MANWFVTGISGGLGKALAEAVLEKGDSVIGTARRESDLKAFAAIAPGRAMPMKLDLSDPEAAGGEVSRALDALPPVDILVNNAGFGMVGAIEETGLDQIRRLFDVNLLGAIAMIQAVLPGMRKRGAGHIVNITSVSGFAPWAGTGIYGASKYAMEGMGQTLAQEVEPLGIKVTNVAPGGMRTSFAGSSLLEAERRIADYDGAARQSKYILAETAGKEAGDPARAARAIVAALSQEPAPRHLFLGEDALRHAQEQFDLVTGEMERWKHYSLSTAFETQNDA